MITYESARALINQLTFADSPTGRWQDWTPRFDCPQVRLRSDPIEVVDGCLRNGHHRLYAALNDVNDSLAVRWIMRIS